MNTLESLDKEYNDLLQHDKQLQFATQAVKNYRKDIENLKKYRDVTNNTTPTNTATHNLNTKTSLFPKKRHVINIDDISKINYDVIRNTPGNISMLDSPNYEDIDAIKARYYRSSLHKMHDQFIDTLNNRFLQKSFNSNNTQNDGDDGDDDDDGNEDDQLSLNEQLSILYKIQQNLIKDYRQIQREQQKWFQLKEVLLDANIQLDLYSKNEWGPDKLNGQNNANTSKSSTSVNTFRNPRKKQRISK